MKLAIAKSWDEASSYLEMLARTVKDDIQPLLAVRGGAPHTISREVFSYVDYLGALYLGTSNVACDKRDGLARVGVRFKCYLEEVMVKADNGYKRYAEVIYQMYRNGPVHNFEPKDLTNNKQVLKWMEYQGLRKNVTLTMGDRKHAVTVDHLFPFKSPWMKEEYYLPVSTKCLVDDLLSSIDYFKGGLGKPNELIKTWNETAEILIKQKVCDFNL